MTHCLRPALGICALCALLLSAFPASAARYQVDVSCEQMTRLPPEVTGLLAHWLPGWWSARHNDPYINAQRTVVLMQHLANACFKSSQKGSILSAVRGFNAMPAVPDNGLKYSCQNFLNASPQWQAMLTLWLQGYVAGETGDTFIDDNYDAVLASYTAQCRRNENLTMGEVARSVGKRAR